MQCGEKTFVRPIHKLVPLDIWHFVWFIHTVGSALSVRRGDVEKHRLHLDTLTLFMLIAIRYS